VLEFEEAGSVPQPPEEVTAVPILIVLPVEPDTAINYNY